MTPAKRCFNLGRRGFSLVELLVCISVISLLCAMLVPAMGQARELARRAVCAEQMHTVHVGLGYYHATHRFRFPPFASASRSNVDLVLSGYWGGSRNPADADAAWLKGHESVNLWPLVDETAAPAGALRCPGSAPEVRDGRTTVFPFTAQFSTYCLRFPESEDLFDNAWPLAYRSGGELLTIYRMYAGGQSVPHANVRYAAPQILATRTYETLGGTVFDPGQSALLADSLGGDGMPPCHGSAYNVLDGDGAVRCVRAPDGLGDLTDDEAVWASLEAR